MLWVIYLFLIFSYLVIGFGWIVGFISFAIKVPPGLPWLTARILISLKSPYQDHHGFTSSEIQNLKAIAETDQASSDWKSGFLTIGILALLLATIQASSQEIGSFAINILRTLPQKQFFFSGWKDILIFIMWIVLSAITFQFALSIFRPLGEYLAKEPINHAILNACNEAIAILTAKGFAQKRTSSIEEKKSNC